MNQFRSVSNRSVSFNIDPRGPCPSGGNREAQNCCLKKSALHKSLADTSPKSLRTNYALPTCYAKGLKDCSKRISREHYISHALLSYLSKNSNLTVSGFPWLHNKSVNLAPKALASNILCGRHNECLSPLDSIAVRFFQALDNRGQSKSNRKLVYLFSGHDVEKWFLKVFCGLSFAKNLNLERPVDASVPIEWCKILFGQSDFPKDQGLYICNEIGYSTTSPNVDLAFRAISNNKRVSGLGAYICRNEFILSMSGFPNRQFDNRSYVYRPLEIYTTSGNFEKSVLFSWEGQADKGSIERTI